MWEYTIKCGLSNQAYLEYIHNKIYKIIIGFGGQISIAKTDVEQILSMAVDEKYKPKLMKILRILLCDVFCEKMKYHHIKENWQNTINNTFLEVLINVCTYFDIELERRIFMQNFNFGNGIMLDTYLDFCFPKLKDKWSDLVNLVNNNADVFFQDENFFELLGFLVLNLSTKVNMVEVSLKQDDSVVIQWDKYSVMYNKNDLVGVVSKLIELSPSNVIVRVPQHSNFTMDRVVQLFGTKVTLDVSL